MTRLFNTIRRRLSDWHHQREARRIIRNIMAQDARQRAEDRRRARG